MEKDNRLTLATGDKLVNLSIGQFVKTPICLAPPALDNRFAYPLLFINHGDTESTEGIIFFARSGDGDQANDRSPAGTIS